MSLDGSPDGKRIAFDLLGDIYTIPVSGGEAKRLTTLPKPVPSQPGTPPEEVIDKGQVFDSQPRFSPDGQSILFVSDRDGADNVYVMNADALGMAAELGTLEKGKLADLVILNANPLHNIQNSIKIFRVMRNGLLYDGDTLDEVWPKARKMPPLWMDTN